MNWIWVFWLTVVQILVKPMIDVRDLSRTYQMGRVQVPALRGISLQILEGSITSIMGKSGSGKSTLLRQLGLLDLPSEGEITIDTHPVHRLSERERGHFRLSLLGYVFQEYALLAELTALENVYLPGMMLGRSGVDYQKRAWELLDLVGLKARAGHLPRELSGGEQQRVAIARSLINQPKYIFADEPTANLDTQAARSVMGSLVRLNLEYGVTVLFVSHDPDDKQYASSHVFLKDGEVTDAYI